MAEYKLIDEMGQDKNVKNVRKDPWSPGAVFGFTVLAGPIGGIMGIMNYDRLNIKGSQKKIAALLLVASVVFPFIPLLGLENIGFSLTKDISKLTMNVFKFILAYYLYGTQKNYFSLHTQMGGNKASITGPILVGIVFVVIVFILAGASLKYFKII